MLIREEDILRGQQNKITRQKKEDGSELWQLCFRKKKKKR